MSLTDAQITVLQSELANDPLGYGYAAAITSGSDGTIADLLNKVRTGADGKPAITVKRRDVAPIELLMAIDVRDFAASPTGVSNVPLTQSWLESVTQFLTLQLTNDDNSKTLIRKNIDRLVGDTQGSQTRLDAVAVRNGSRAEQLFGINTVVAVSDVSFALRGTR